LGFIARTILQKKATSNISGIWDFTLAFIPIFARFSCFFSSKQTQSFNTRPFALKKFSVSLSAWMQQHQSSIVDFTSHYFNVTRVQFPTNEFIATKLKLTNIEFESKMIIY